MSYFIELNNKYFFKGFFYWFGIEKNPFSKEVDNAISTNPHLAIKNDLTKIKKNYRKAYSELKKEALEIE